MGKSKRLAKLKKEKDAKAAYDRVLDRILKGDKAMTDKYKKYMAEKKAKEGEDK